MSFAASSGYPMPYNPKPELPTTFVAEFCYCIYHHQSLITQISTQPERLVIVASSQLLTTVSYIKLQKKLLQNITGFLKDEPYLSLGEGLMTPHVDHHHSCSDELPCQAGEGMLKSFYLFSKYLPSVQRTVLGTEIQRLIKRGPLLPEALGLVRGTNEQKYNSSTK